jgi:enoyl-CoA hydratase
MLHLEDRDGVRTLRLDHGKAHALDRELTGALRRAIAAARDDESVRAIVFTGTGGIFCAGVDLRRVLAGGADYVERFVPELVGAFHDLFAFPRPAVAAVNGHAIAGGCVLAAACDYRLMAEGNGTIGVPELRVGVPFPLVALEILRFATSPAHLQELVYRGKSYHVSEACRVGLVDEVTAPARLVEEARAVAARLASDPAARFRITKRQLRRPVLDRIARYAGETDAQVVEEWKNPRTLEAIREYMDEVKRRRRP